MFKNLYLWEVKKLISLKGIIILVIIAILALLLINAMFNITDNIEVTVEEGVVIEGGIDVPELDDEEVYPSEISIAGITYSEDGSITASKSGAKLALALAKEALEEAKGTKRDKYFYRSTDPIYPAKAQVAMWQYVVDNEIYNKPFTPYSGMASLMLGSITTKTAQGFMSLYLSMMGGVIIIYGIVCGANAYGKEIKKGTLKMVMIRPITRSKLTTSKVLAALSVASTFFIGAVTIAYVFGIIAYKNIVIQNILFVFNASRGFMGNSNTVLLFIILGILIQIWAYVLFAMALATVTKSNVLGIIIPIIVTSGIPNLILMQFGLARFLFSYSSGMIMEFFTVGSPFAMLMNAGSLMGGSNFWLNIGVLGAYIAAFIAGTYIVFNKRDIA